MWDIIDAILLFNVSNDESAWTCIKRLMTVLFLLFVTAGYEL